MARDDAHQGRMLRDAAWRVQQRSRHARRRAAYSPNCVTRIFSAVPDAPPSGFHVLGEAGSGAEAIAAAHDLRPDVVLLDVQLPDANGFAIAQLLTQAGDGPSVVMCSIRAAEDYDQRGEHCGAAGFLTKSDLSAEAVRRLVAVQPHI